MSQLLKHYSVNRDNLDEYATTQEHFSRYLFGVVMPNIEGLEIVHTLQDSNNIQFFLSTCPDDVVIEEREGIEIITQEQWDLEIETYDLSQETKRYDILRKNRDILLDKSDWIVIKSLESNTPLPQEFVAWRQALRDLPNSTSFPSEIPQCPESIDVDINIYTNYIGEVKSIAMINDPLPDLEDQSVLIVQQYQEPDYQTITTGEGVPGDIPQG